MSEIDRTGETHPHEHLTDLVDGSISAEDRTRTEAHVRACAQCRLELDLARRARTALMALPELDIPWSVTRPVLEEARGRRTVAGGWSERLTRVAWATGAAAAAAVIGVFIWISVAGPGSGGPGTGQDNASAPEDSRGGAASPTSPPENEFISEGAQEFPVVEDLGDQDFDAAGVDAFADEVARQAGTASGSEVPLPPATSTEDGAAPGGTEVKAAHDPLSCVLNAASVPRAARVVRVLTAQFEGEPAVIGAFLDGPRDRAPDRVTIWVAAQFDCTLLHYTSRPIP